MADRITPKPMTLEQIGNAIQELVSDATTYMEAELSPQRARATMYNRGDPLGNEETGRSQIVLTVVRDVVGAVKPSLVRLFLPTSGHIIRYDARPKTQAEIAQRVQAAQQATGHINEVVLHQDNNGHPELPKRRLERRMHLLRPPNRENEVRIARDGCVGVGH